MPQTKDGYITEKDHLKSLRKTTRDIFESARTRMASVSGTIKRAFPARTKQAKPKVTPKPSEHPLGKAIKERKQLFESGF